MIEDMKIIPPEGYEIDRENSTFECIKFKPIQKKRFIDDTYAEISGYCIDSEAEIEEVHNVSNRRLNYDVFATEKQAKSAIAMARISQIMVNDERFGGVVTDEEWEDSDINKYVITREENHMRYAQFFCSYEFLTFHTPEQRKLFMEENEQLVKDYLMIE